MCIVLICSRISISGSNILLIDSVMEHRNMGKGGKAAVIEALDQVLLLFIFFLFVGGHVPPDPYSLD